MLMAVILGIPVSDIPVPQMRQWRILLATFFLSGITVTVHASADLANDSTAKDNVLKLTPSDLSAADIQSDSHEKPSGNGLSTTTIKQAIVVTIEPYTAYYKARASGLPVKLVRALKKQANGHYVLSFSAKAFISKIEESSEFVVNDTGVVVPQLYRYTRTGLGSNKKQKMNFDWHNNTAHYLDKKRDRTLDLDIGMLDKVTTYFQLRRDLIAGRQHMSHQVIDKGKIKTFNYKVTGHEQLNTPLGKIDTAVVTRIRKSNERMTKIWFAVDWNYLMVKLVQSKDGESHEILIDKLGK